MFFDVVKKMFSQVAPYKIEKTCDNHASTNTPCQVEENKYQLSQLISACLLSDFTVGRWDRSQDGFGVKYDP